MNVEEAILTRRSVRRFLPKPVPEPVVRKIIEVSARAPSGHNIQPWKVYAIAGEVKDRLCADILKAAETEPDKHRPEYEYYPTEWHEPYIGRRRELGYDLYAKLGIARDDVLKGRASGRRWAGRGRGSWGTHKKPGVVGSDPEQSGQAGGAFQLRFRGGASPA